MHIFIRRKHWKEDNLDSSLYEQPLQTLWPYQ